MRYLGGKARIAKQIAYSILVSTSRRDCYLEPFLGGGNAFEHIAHHFARPHCSDIHEDLMIMWQAVRDGWVPPSVVTEDQYRWLKDQPPSALRAFAGFFCSFGGVWFSKYARNARGTNYAGESHRGIMRVAPVMHRSFVVRASYHQWQPSHGWVVYADPPYKERAGYSGTASDFDHHLFWQTMDRWNADGAHVFVSEYTAPPHWQCLGEVERPFAQKASQQRTIERLFTRLS